jgi:hypothetical protein
MGALELLASQVTLDVTARLVPLVVTGGREPLETLERTVATGPLDATASTEGQEPLVSPATQAAMERQVGADSIISVSSLWHFLRCGSCN